MKWKPFRSGALYTCQDCPSFADLRDDRDRWRKIADDLYKQLAVSFCWHCGHETTRCVDADRAADNYRQAVCGD